MKKEKGNQEMAIRDEICDTDIQYLMFMRDVAIPTRILKILARVLLSDFIMNGQSLWKYSQIL